MDNKRKNQSIVYVNFFPYDNAGNILDYIVSSFNTVIHFSFDPQRINKSASEDILRIYKNGRIAESIHLLRLPLPFPRSAYVLFLSIPLTLFLMVLHILWNLYKIKKSVKIISYYFSVNAFSAYIGTICQGLGFVQKTIFWVWDYYSVDHTNWKVHIARSIYWKFDKMATTSSSKLCFLDKRLLELRKEKNILPKDVQCPIVPIGTNPSIVLVKKSSIIVGHFGVLKRTQGIDYLFENLSDLRKKFPNLAVEIVGSGIDEEYFKSRAKKFSSIVTFHGFIKDAEQLRKIVQNWSVGIALYTPQSHVSPWSDPSKVKYYLSQGIPVIITNVIAFASEIEKYKAGVVVSYGDKLALLSAFKEVLQKPKFYQKNALKLAQVYDYKKIYPQLFD